MVTLSLSNVAGVFGNVFAFALISAPIKTMLEIKRDNGVGNRSVLNYVATYVNAVCVVAYTLPEKRYLVAVINAVAVVTELLYSCFYRRYAQGRARTVATWAIVGELAWALVVFVGYFGGFYGGRNEDLRVHLFGTLAAFTSAAMYVAMIPDTWAVYTTRNVENQNILLLLAGVGNCTSWMLHAIKPKDLYIEVPNAMGVGFTVLQTLVWVTIWFRFRNAAPAQQQQQQQQQQNDPAQNQQQQQQQQNDLAQNQQQQINPAQNQQNVELQPVAV